MTRRCWGFISVSDSHLLVPSTPTDNFFADMGGIGVQEFFILVFFGLAIQFQRKVVRIDGAWRGESWRPLLYTLYFSLTLITVRCDLSSRTRAGTKSRCH